MTEETNLHITQNNLYRDSEMKSLKLENQFYCITLFYVGDYNFDKENHRINTNYISIVCKEKANMSQIPHIWLYNEKIMFHIDENDISAKNAKRYISSLSNAIETANNLKNILDEYFYQYAKKRRVTYVLSYYR